MPIRKKETSALLSSLLAFSIGTLAQDVIPRGTILPIRFDSSLSLKTTPGRTIKGRIMQDVPVSAQTRIREGAKVFGHVIRVVHADARGYSEISFQFDQLVFSGHTIPITTALRAMASFVEVEDAQVPLTGPDRGTPSSAWTTTQIGGDTVYRGGGPVVAGSSIVGQPTYNGVLGRIYSVPGSECADADDNENGPQALWVFSANACGTYGFANVGITRSGRSAPLGEITLASTGGKLTVPSGSGMLLRIINSGNEKTYSGGHAE